MFRIRIILATSSVDKTDQRNVVGEHPYFFLKAMEKLFGLLKPTNLATPVTFMYLSLSSNSLLHPEICYIAINRCAKQFFKTAHEFSTIHSDLNSQLTDFESIKNDLNKFFPNRLSLNKATITHPSLGMVCLKRKMHSIG